MPRNTLKCFGAKLLNGYLSLFLRCFFQIRPRSGHIDFSFLISHFPKYLANENYSLLPIAFLQIMCYNIRDYAKGAPCYAEIL